jgi:hypothetical protein
VKVAYSVFFAVIPAYLIIPAYLVIPAQAGIQ